MRRTLYSKLEFYAEKKKKKNISSKRNCLISRINPKLPDYVRVQGIRYSTKILYSKLKYYAEDENDVNRYMSTWTFNSMFKFKLQDYQYEEHYIPNWNFMPTKNIMINCFLVRNV